MGDGQLDLLADQPLQKVRNIGQHIGQLQHFGAQGLLAAEGEQLAGQAGGAVRIGADLLDIVIVAVTRRVPQQHQVAGAEDRGQHIIEIVRDPARQLPHRLHLGRLRNLALQSGLLGIVGQAEQHRRLAKAPHPRQAQRHRVLGRTLEAHGKVAARRRALREAPDRIGDRPLVFLHHQVGRIGRRRLILARCGAHEGGIGEQQPSVTVGHGEAQRQLPEQRLKMRDRGAGLGSPAANADAVIGDQHQRRRLVVVHGPGGIGIGERHEEHGQRRAALAVARPGDAVGIILPQQGGKLLAGEQDRRIAGGARRETRTGGADLAVGIDHRKTEARLRQRAAQLAVKVRHQFGDRVGQAQRGKCPDQIIVAASRAGDRGFPPALTVLEQVRLA